MIRTLALLPLALPMARADDPIAARKVLHTLAEALPEGSIGLLVSVAGLEQPGYPLLVPGPCAKAIQALDRDASKWTDATIEAAHQACPAPRTVLPVAWQDAIQAGSPDETALMVGLLDHLLESTGPTAASKADHARTLPSIVAGSVARARAGSTEWPGAGATIGRESNPDLARSVDSCRTSELAFPGTTPSELGTRAEVVAVFGGDTVQVLPVRSDGAVARSCLIRATQEVLADTRGDTRIELVTWVTR